MFGPNITGSTKAIAYNRTSGTFVGAFVSTSEEATSTTTTASGTGWPTAWIDFNAHDSNSLYVGSNFQPKALSLLPCIRY